MIIWLLILIGCGVAFSFVGLFSTAEQKGRKKDDELYQSGIERVLRQIKDQLFQLEIDVKRSSRINLKLSEDIKTLK
ncbi:MAG: hypothetical protein JW867_01125, partial [Candidatus Omnitrophica bacterium]|nr:hypothetical protein [Candidatus Omnitrophota bacterium]